jgi:hypothetical protein
MTGLQSHNTWNFSVLSLTIVQTSQQSEFNFKRNINLYSVVLSIISTTYILLLTFLKMPEAQEVYP